MNRNLPTVTALDAVIIQAAAAHLEVSAGSARKQEHRKRMRSRGLHLGAFDTAMRYMREDADKRLVFDRTYQLVRAALGHPLQRDMFDVVDDETPQ